MLYYDRIYVSGGTKVIQTNDLHNFQPCVCGGFHDLMQETMIFN